MVVRVSQTTLEVLEVSSAAGDVRASQTVAEVLHDDASFQVRASQTVLEVLCSLQNFVGYVSIAGGGG